jgi:hypothetical protein
MRWRGRAGRRGGRGVRCEEVADAFVLEVGEGSDEAGVERGSEE